MRKTVAILLPILVGCGHSQLVNLKVDALPEPASIHLDGNRVCEKTPCEFQSEARFVFVGTMYSSDGYECTGSHTVEAYPITSNGSLFPQQVSIDTCLSKNHDSTSINFDLKKPSHFEPIKLEPPRKIRFAGIGYQSNRWHNKEHSDVDSSTSDFYLSYGTEIWSSPGTVVLGELMGSKQTPLSTNQYQFGGFAHLHFTEVPLLYLTGGLAYRMMENEFSRDGLLPYVGGGLIINHKNLAFLNWMGVRREEVKQRIGFAIYDLVLQAGVFLHSKMKAWDSQVVNLGVRYYF